MRRKFFIISILLSLSVLCVAGALAFAGSKEIKARMKARVPVINSLKDNGIVGESYRGYLEFVGSKKPGGDVVDAENSDRKKVYSAIAKQQGVNAELVGKRRAKQIAQRAKPGHWIQNENGKWYQKK